MRDLRVAIIGYGLSGRFFHAPLIAATQGLEVVSGANGRQHIEACTQMASTHGFSGSVGSDFHSPQFAWNPIGRSLKLPDCITPVWRGRLP